MKLSTLIRQAAQVLETCGDMDVLVRLPDVDRPDLSEEEWELDSTNDFECDWNGKHFFEIILSRR